MRNLIAGQLEDMTPLLGDLAVGAAGIASEDEAWPHKRSEVGVGHLMPDAGQSPRARHAQRLKLSLHPVGARGSPQ